MKTKLAVIAVALIAMFGLSACIPPPGWKVLDPTHMEHTTQKHGDYDEITPLDNWCDLIRSCPGWDTPDVTFWAYHEFFYWTGSSWERYDDYWESYTCELLGPNAYKCDPRVVDW